MNTQLYNYSDHVNQKGLPNLFDQLFKSFLSYIDVKYKLVENETRNVDNYKIRINITTPRNDQNSLERLSIKFRDKVNDLRYKTEASQHENQIVKADKNDSLKQAELYSMLEIRKRSSFDGDNDEYVEKSLNTAEFIEQTDSKSLRHLLTRYNQIIDRPGDQQYQYSSDSWSASGSSSHDLEKKNSEDSFSEFNKSFTTVVSLGTKGFTCYEKIPFENELNTEISLAEPMDLDTFKEETLEHTSTQIPIDRVLSEIENMSQELIEDLINDAVFKSNKNSLESCKKSVSENESFDSLNFETPASDLMNDYYSYHYHHDQIEKNDSSLLLNEQINQDFLSIYANEEAESQDLMETSIMNNPAELLDDFKKHFEALTTQIKNLEIKYQNKYNLKVDIIKATKGTDSQDKNKEQKKNSSEKEKSSNKGSNKDEKRDEATKDSVDRGENREDGSDKKKDDENDEDEKDKKKKSKSETETETDTDEEDDDDKKKKKKGKKSNEKKPQDKPEKKPDSNKETRKKNDLIDFENELRELSKSSVEDSQKRSVLNTIINPQDQTPSTKNPQRDDNNNNLQDESAKSSPRAHTAQNESSPKRSPKFKSKIPIPIRSPHSASSLISKFNNNVPRLEQLKTDALIYIACYLVEINYIPREILAKISKYPVLSKKIRVLKKNLKQIRFNAVKRPVACEVSLRPTDLYVPSFVVKRQKAERENAKKIQNEKISRDLEELDFEKIEQLSRLKDSGLEKMRDLPYAQFNAYVFPESVILYHNLKVANLLESISHPRQAPESALPALVYNEEIANALMSILNHLLQRHLINVHFAQDIFEMFTYEVNFGILEASLSRLNEEKERSKIKSLVERNLESISFKSYQASQTDILNPNTSLYSFNKKPPLPASAKSKHRQQASSLSVSQENLSNQKFNKISKYRSLDNEELVRLLMATKSTSSLVDRSVLDRSSQSTDNFDKEASLLLDLKTKDELIQQIDQVVVPKTEDISNQKKELKSKVDSVLDSKPDEENKQATSGSAKPKTDCSYNCEEISKSLRRGDREFFRTLYHQFGLLEALEPELFTEKNTTETASEEQDEFVEKTLIIEPDDEIKQELEAFCNQLTQEKIDRERQELMDDEVFQSCLKNLEQESEEILLDFGDN